MDPASNMWRIDVMEAAAPDGFDPGGARPLFVPEELGLAGIKDPNVYGIGGLYHMLVSYAPNPPAVTDELRRTMHGTADVYNTGTVKSHSGLATSEDGRHWAFAGDILSPPDTGWDAYRTRLGSLLSLPPWFVGFYDGSASVAENYEEQAGLAISLDLRHWRRITTAGPWVASPHGCIRYIEALAAGEVVCYYYEYTRADGSPELRANRVALS